MKVKELKEKLEHVSDDAEVVLYDGLDEGDVFCEEVEETTAEEYDHYCKADSYVDELEANTKICVLLGY